MKPEVKIVHAVAEHRQGRPSDESLKGPNSLMPTPPEPIVTIKSNGADVRLIGPDGYDLNDKAPVRKRAYIGRVAAVNGVVRSRVKPKAAANEVAD
jgi:hypothetical protein